MRNIAKTIILGFLGAAILLSGCATSTGGSGAPSSQATGNGSGSTEDLHGAPRVEHPLDTTKFLSAPCSVLTDQEKQSLNLAVAGKSGNGISGPNCDWNTSTGNHLGVTIEASTNYPNGLSTLYKKNSQGQLGVFKPLPDIAGYPTVQFDLGNSADVGGCSLAVGVSDKLAYLISTSSNDKSDPCDTTKKVAAMVIQTLKGGS